jgi:hypothetical protein
LAIPWSFQSKRGLPAYISQTENSLYISIHGEGGLYDFSSIYKKVMKLSDITKWEQELRCPLLIHEENGYDIFIQEVKG